MSNLFTRIIARVHSVPKNSANVAFHAVSVAPDPELAPVYNSLISTAWLFAVVISAGLVLLAVAS